MAIVTPGSKAPPDWRISLSRWVAAKHHEPLIASSSCRDVVSARRVISTPEMCTATVTRRTQIGHSSNAQLMLVGILLVLAIGSYRRMKAMERQDRPTG